MLPYNIFLVISQTLSATWSTKNQVKAVEVVLPNPSSVYANFPAVKGIHVENRLMFSCISFVLGPWPLPSRKPKPGRLRPTAQRQLLARLCGKGTPPSTRHSGRWLFSAQCLVHFLNGTLFLLWESKCFSHKIVNRQKWWLMAVAVCKMPNGSRSGHCKSQPDASVLTQCFVGSQWWGLPPSGFTGVAYDSGGIF